MILRSFVVGGLIYKIKDTPYYTVTNYLHLSSTKEIAAFSLIQYRALFEDIVALYGVLQKLSRISKRARRKRRRQQ